MWCNGSGRRALVYVCPNPLCKEVLSSQSGLTNHFLHFATCDNVNTSVVAFLEDSQQDDADRGTSLAGATSELDPCVHSDSEEAPEYRFDFVENYPETAHEEANARLADPGNFAAGIHVIARQAGVAHTVDDHAEIKLLKILDDVNVPHYLFKDILDWSADAKACGYAFRPNRRSRPAHILNLEKRFSLRNCRPMQTPVMFPEDNLRIDVTHFDFFSQLASLLKDKSLTGDLTHLVVPQDNLFAKYKSPNGRLGTFNSGSWYHKARDYVCEPNSNDWMCPIIYGCDETIVGSSQGRASVTPLMFTLSILNEYIRNKRTAWRPLGYVYDLAQHGKGMLSADMTTPRELKPEEKAHGTIR
jgi:hypothetical protein